MKWEANVVDKRIETTIKAISEETDTIKIEEHNMWLGYYKAIKEFFIEYKITLPNIYVQDTMKINGSKRNVILFTRGKGHTESDIVLWLPTEKILFTGDLLFVGFHPWLGDGFVNDWVNYLEDLKKLNAKFIVSGHGIVGNNLQMDQMINYIKMVNSFVDKAIQDNLSEDELKSTPIPDEFKSWWFGRFFSPNLVIQYKIKTGKLEEQIIVNRGTFRDYFQEF